MLKHGIKFVILARTSCVNMLHMYICVHVLFSTDANALCGTAILRTVTTRSN